MQANTSSPSPPELFRAAYERITAQGTHLSGELEQLFRALKPGSTAATKLRSRLYQAVRYADWKGAWAGALDGVLDPGRAYLPAWLRERMYMWMPAALADAPTFVRVNTRKCSVAECAHALAPYHPIPVRDACIQVQKPFGLFASEAFRNGWFEQQDVNSQRVCDSLFSGPLADMQWKLFVDLCAGAGGKTLHAAALAVNKRRILAMDVASDKLERLRVRATRAGVGNVETRWIDTTKVLKRLTGLADVVLVDAPCSGTGALRRNPDILHHLTQDRLDELKRTQAELLRRALAMCKPGGVVAYVTCSVLPEEGKEQVAALGAGTQLLSEWETAIGEDGGDGFYMAVLTKSDAA
jgi:16S rRNA (cytosine967-C5)-methyltransferase